MSLENESISILNQSRKGIVNNIRIQTAFEYNTNPSRKASAYAFLDSLEDEIKDEYEHHKSLRGINLSLPYDPLLQDFLFDKLKFRKPGKTYNSFNKNYSHTFILTRIPGLFFKKIEIEGESTSRLVGSDYLTQA